jgi:hypothetical protein
VDTKRRFVTLSSLIFVLIGSIFRIIASAGGSRISYDLGSIFLAAFFMMPILLLIVNKDLITSFFPFSLRVMGSNKSYEWNQLSDFEKVFIVIGSLVVFLFAIFVFYSTLRHILALSPSLNDISGARHGIMWKI